MARFRITANHMIVGVILVGVVLIVWLLYRLFKDTQLAPSDTVQQVLWLIFAVVLLLLVLLLCAVILRQGDTTTPRGALGLPEGSIAAVIALLLLILFSLSSVYVFQQIRQSERQGIESAGLSIEDVRRFPPERIIRLQREGTTEPPTYTATLVNPSSTSVEVGRTTLATISTLLVAIVGFYFGQRGVERGAKLRLRERGDGTQPGQAQNKPPDSIDKDPLGPGGTAGSD